MEILASATMTRAIMPMFNNYIDATSNQVGGWVDDPKGELMGGHALMMCGLAA